MPKPPKFPNTPIYSWRRKQLAEMDSLEIDAICAPAIGTADAVLNLPPDKQSPILKGTAAKKLIDTIASLAGFKGAPLWEMHAVLKKLSAGHVVLHALPLPEPNAEEELFEFAEHARGLFPYLKTNEAQPLAHRILTRWDSLGGPAPEHRQLHKFFVRNDPNYVPPPNLFAQFEEHLSLTQQIAKMNADHRYKVALEIFLKMPPAGRA